MKRAYVGNIPFKTTDDDLKKFFEPYRLVEITIMYHRDTGKSRGFAFVEFETEKDFEAALWSHDGRDIDGRKIVVNDAIEKRRT